MLRSRAPKAVPPRRVGSRYLLSGLLRCGGRHAAMFGTGAKSGRFHYYVCASAYRTSRQACGMRPIPQSLIEGKVLEKIQEVILRQDHLEELGRLTNEELTGSLSEITARMSALESQSEEIDRRLERLYDALETGKLALHDLAPRIQDLSEKRDLIQKTTSDAREVLDSRRAEMVTQEVVLDHLKDLRGVLDYGSVPERRAFLGSFIQSVEREDARVTIHYRLPVPPEHILDDLDPSS